MITKSAVADREKVLDVLRDATEHKGKYDSVQIQAAKLLGQAQGLFTTDTAKGDTSTSKEVKDELVTRLNKLLDTTGTNQQSNTVTSDTKKGDSVSRGTTDTKGVTTNISLDDLIQSELGTGNTH